MAYPFADPDLFQSISRVITAWLFKACWNTSSCLSFGDIQIHFYDIWTNLPFLWDDSV